MGTTKTTAKSSTESDKYRAILDRYPKQRQKDEEDSSTREQCDEDRGAKFSTVYVGAQAISVRMREVGVCLWDDVGDSCAF